MTNKDKCLMHPATDSIAPPSTPEQYTYLLRIWRADVGQPWRFTLRGVGAEETQYFPRLTAFVTKLWAELNQGAQ